VSERFPELTSDADLVAFCSILEELQHVLVLGEEPAHTVSAADEERLLTLTGSEWEQILLADSVYASITGRQEGAASPITTGELGRVVIRILPLHWHTLVLGSGPALAALREVHTPNGVLLQGFAVAPEAVIQWLGAGPLPLGFSPAPPASSTAVSAVVSATGWILETEPGPVLASAAVRGRTEVLQFRRTFAFTAAAVFLAAAAVVWILFQMDRLARQRARFAAAAAHELKTPLSGLLLHSEMLAEDLGDPEHRTSYAATVSAEAARLGRVVSNMLDLARLERGALVTTARPGDLGAAVSRCVERALVRSSPPPARVTLVPP